MNKFEISTLNPKTCVIAKLSVLSFEMSIYLVQIRCEQGQGLVFESQRPKRFNSCQQIRDTFAEFKVLAAEMIHQSPYDEMIGNPASAQHLGHLPFSLHCG